VHTTLAALAYGIPDRRHGNLTFVDFGAGSLDISILELQDGL
jgi:molecular chaperone DnaK (HSP70)